VIAPASYLARGWVLLRWDGGKAREVGRFVRWKDADADAQKIAAETSIEAAETWEKVKSGGNT